MDSALYVNTVNDNQEMKKPIELWQLLLGAVTTLIGVWGIVYMMNKDSIVAVERTTKLQENHEVRITQLERQSQVTYDKLDKLDDKVTQVLIILNDKENKK